MKFTAGLIIVISTTLLCGAESFGADSPVQSTDEAVKIGHSGRHGVHTFEASISYRLNGRTFAPEYMGNRSTLDALNAAIDEIGPFNIDSIHIKSFASPDGPIERNERLAERRATDTKQLILTYHPSLEGRIKCEGRGEDWDGLARLVENDSNITIETRQRILIIAHSSYSDPNARKALLRRIPDDPAVGNVYSYLVGTHFPLLRNSITISFYTKPLPRLETKSLFPATKACVIAQEGTIARTIVIGTPTETAAATDDEPGRKARETILALKTNLLYDAVTAVNAEIEVPLGSCMSIMAEAVLPWWEFQKNKYALMLTYFSVEPRYWFRHWGHDDRKMLGWFAGAYYIFGADCNEKMKLGNVEIPLLRAKADIQLDNRINYQANIISAGITCGFVIPLGKNRRWGNMEFSISAGWARINYQHYQPAANYEYIVRDVTVAGSGVVQYFGPTKAKISLVIPIRIRNSKE